MSNASAVGGGGGGGGGLLRIDLQAVWLLCSLLLRRLGQAVKRVD